MMDKKYCNWSNACGKTLCCAYCKQARCDERCGDDKSTCKYLRSQERANLSVKTVNKKFPLKKWDKDQIK